MNTTIEKFGYPGTLIHEYQHWVVLLRPQQVTLGSLVLACKQPVQQFHQVSAEGFAELATAVRHIEQGLKPLVDYHKMNYLMLMMVDPDVHFHVIPRYPDAMRFDDVELPDAGWPGPPALGQFTETSATLNGAIISTLQRHWPED